MSGELASKLRVVKCPNCRQLLPEYPGYNLYKCGGCGTTLQAKKRSVAVNSESGTQETDAAPRNALDLVSEDKKCSNREQLVPPRENGSKAKATSSSSGGCFLDGNVGRGQNKNGECNGELLRPINLSDEELESELDIYKLSHRRHRVSNKGCSNKTSHCEIEEIHTGNLLLEGSKDGLICASDQHGNNEKSNLVGVKSEKEIIRSDLEGAEELNNVNLLLAGAQEELISGSDEEDANNDKSDLVGSNPEVEITANDLVSGSDGEDANKDKLALAGANPEVKISGSDLEGAKELHNGNLSQKGIEEELNSGLDGEDANNDKSALVGENLEVEIEEELNMHALDGKDPNNEQSVLVGAKSEVDITESASATKRSSTENFVSEKGSILRVPPGKLEEGTSDNPVSSNKQQKQAQKNIHNSSDRVRSVDTLDTAELTNHSSELSGTLEGFYKSPPTRSYHAYDGSISSYDGIEEWFPIRHFDSLENANTVANGVSERRSRKGKGLVNSMSYGDNGTQHQSYLPHGRHHVMKDSRRNQNKVLETTTQGHGHWMRTKRDDFPPRIPFHHSGSQSHYESSSPSNQMHDDFYGSSSLFSPDSCEDTDQEKKKLLRMIYRLQDQLNTTRSMSGETNGRVYTDVPYKAKHIPAYHSHDLHEGRFSHGLDCPRCNGRCNHGINWRRRHKLSRIPSSAGVTSSPHHADHSCFHCCPHERNFSADLLQHEELYRSYPGQDCRSFHGSYPSSPQRFKTSKLPVYGRETKSDDLRFMASEVKKYLREKQNLAKRYYKPVAGGAPFVTCHKCLNLLHLPADFLLFKRVCHRLKCGECSEVLKFSLQNGSHIVSFTPNAIGPPSSNLNDQKEVINNNSNLPSVSHANYYHYTPADPISYSEDYGLSVSKSYSSERDHVPLTQFHPLHDSGYDNPIVSRGTFEPLTEKIVSRHSSTRRRHWKLSSEKEALPPPKSSSLHQLMGYSSPGQVIRGTASSVEGIKSSYSIEKDDPSQVREERHN